MPPALEAQSPNHWTAREFPLLFFKTMYIKCYLLLLLLSSFNCVRLCDPRDGSPPGSPVPGILQARTLEWVKCYLFIYKLIIAAVAAAAAKSLQSCPTLCDPIDGSPPGSPVPGILQARTLEWVAISFSNA